MATSTSDSFARLLGRARGGSVSAIGRLLDGQRSWLKSIAARRLSPAIAAKLDPSDMVQDCQVGAAANISQFRGDDLGQFRGWLKAILDRRIKRVFRYLRQARRDTTREAGPARLPDVPAKDDGAALSRLARTEDEDRQRELLRRALAVLDDQDRSVLDMRLQQGLTHGEIAARLGIAPAAARKRFGRALARLKDVVDWVILWDECGAVPLKAEALALWRFRSIPPGEVARQLGLPWDAVACWVEEARRLLKSTEGGSL